MADIAIEIESICNFIEDPALYSRIWMQHIPSKYTAGELSIRFIGDNSESETGYNFRIDREYQFVYFGGSELDCISKATKLQRKLNSTHEIKLKDSTRHIRIGSFSLSQPFKTESGEVFAVIGVLRAEIREARTFEELPKIGGIVVEVKPNDRPDDGFEIIEGACK